MTTEEIIFHMRAGATLQRNKTNGALLLRYSDSEALDAGIDESSRSVFKQLRRSRVIQEKSSLLNVIQEFELREKR